MKLEDEELEAIIIYQISAIMAYAKTFDLEIESVRCHGALKNELNENEHSAAVIAEAIKAVGGKSVTLKMITATALRSEDDMEAEGVYHTALTRLK